MQLIQHYFPDITTQQQQQFAQLQTLYADWNEKINVISRKDIDNLYERHILHSLSVAKFIQFRPGTKVMDLGTGGGFPGVPLAILFPEARFHLVDSIAKKLKVIEAVKESCALNNMFTFHSRAEDMPYQYEFVVTRAVAPVKELLQWTKGKYAARSQHNYHNGLIALKGGDLTEELKASGIANATVTSLSTYFTEPSFQEKSLVYIRR